MLWSNECKVQGKMSSPDRLMGRHWGGGGFLVTQSSYSNVVRLLELGKANQTHPLLDLAQVPMSEPEALGPVFLLWGHVFAFPLTLVALRQMAGMQSRHGITGFGLAYLACAHVRLTALWKALTPILW